MGVNWQKYFIDRRTPFTTPQYSTIRPPWKRKKRTESVYAYIWGVGGWRIYWDHPHYSHSPLDSWGCDSRALLPQIPLDVWATPKPATTLAQLASAMDENQGKQAGIHAACLATIWGSSVPHPQAHFSRYMNSFSSLE